MSSESSNTESLQVEDHVKEQLLPYLPNGHTTFHTTLTFATSLDSAISLQPGAQTVLSGPRSKAMTHYLRMRHDAILVGVGTAVADDPGLSCRIDGATLADQPRPVVLDPSCRWAFTAESKVLRLARNGKGKAPWILTAPDRSPPPERVALLEELGGGYFGVSVPDLDEAPASALAWEDILHCLIRNGVKSVMIEGGAAVINELLKPGNAECVDSVIVTIAPTWLGKGSLMVQPERRTTEDGELAAAARLKQVKWIPLDEDAIVCGRFNEV